MGEVSIYAQGLVEAPKGDFSVAAPLLKGARKNTRTIALYEPPNMLLSMTRTEGVRELSLDEQPRMTRFQWPQWEGRLARQYFIEQADATIGVKVQSWNTIFDTRTAALLSVAEKNIWLRCAIAVQPERGRVFFAEFSDAADVEIDRGPRARHGARRGL